MASIGSLTADLRLESAAFMRDMTKATRAVQSNTAQMRKSMQQVEKASRNLNRQFGHLRNAAAALAGALAVRQFTMFTRSAIDSAGAIQDVADKVALTTKQLQQMRFAAAQTGVATTALDMGMQRFSRRIAEVAAGQGELLKVAQQYNVGLRDSSGQMRANIDILKDFADVIRDAESDQERLRIAFKLFDSEGAALVNTLREGRVGLQQYMDQAVAFGAVMSVEVIARAKLASDNLAALEIVYKTAFNTAIIENFADGLTLTEENLKAARDTGQAFGDIVGAAMRAVAAVAKFVAANMREIAAVLAGLVALKAAAVILGLAKAMAALAVAMRAAAISGGLLNAVLVGSKKGLIGIVAAVAAAGAVLAMFGDEAKAAAAEAKQLLADFTGTGTATETANAAAKEYITTLENERQQAKALAEAHKRGAAAVETVTIAQETFKAEQAAGVKFTKQQIQEMGRLIAETRKYEKQIEATKKAQEEAARKAKEAAEEQRRAVERSVDSIVDYAGDTFADMFSDTEFSWAKMWERFRQTAIQTMAKMAAEIALRPIIAPIVASFMGAGGAAAAGGGAGVAGVGGGMGGLGGLGNIFSLGSAANNAGLFGNTFSGIGSSVSGFLSTPLWTNTTWGMTGAITTPGMTIGGALGAAGLGAMGGGLIAQLTGGNQLGGSIGGGLGALAGTAIGGPIGGIIGGAAGGFLGGMFGGGRSVGPNGLTNILNRDGQLVLGTTGVDNGAVASVTIQAAQQAVQAINDLAQQLNLTIRSAGPGKISQGVEPGPQSAQDFIARFISGGGFGSSDPIIDRVLRSGRVSASSIQSDIGLARMISDLENGVTALDKAIRDVTESYTAQIDRAKQLGLETAKLIELRDREIASVKAQARTPFVQAAGGIVDFLQGQALSSSSTLTPTQRLVEAQRQFSDLLGRVRGGEVGLSGSLTQSAGQLLDIGRNNFASSVDFANLERFVRSNLLNVAEEISSDTFFDAQVEATRQQTEVLSDDLTRLNETVEKMRAEIRLLGEKLAA